MPKDNEPDVADFANVEQTMRQKWMYERSIGHAEIGRGAH